MPSATQNYFNKPLLKIPMIFGAATGVMAFLFFLGLYAIGVMPLGNNKVLDFGIFLIMMVAACWYYRRNIGHGYMHFWEGLTICYVVNTVGAFVVGWLIFLFVEFVDPDLFAKYIAEMQQLLVQGKADLVKDIGEAEFQSMLKAVVNTKPGQLITDEMAKKTVMAVLPILIISLIFRRQEPVPLRPKS
ncbi:DUF4199 domain-containing protein [Persicitalea jodogahamensis]|uniref:DUF4199 domain-containing protein n=1 Tax=Persicitalea jodogahamensis TaxID=402147 RepID=A0A8J3GAG2_9BACT|nr:DUF4199 domain-containing protein [Persicitalea jodogahamensis]GHB74001.1 hypothetical protein GCM10007390_30320 [Persicitalea jodogahamensis]